MSKIKTTHVGSLPRSNELSELLFKKDQKEKIDFNQFDKVCLLYTSPSPRDISGSRMPSSA